MSYFAKSVIAPPARPGVVPGHCDATVNLYDWLVVIRDGRVEDVRPITARGALL